MAVNARQSIPIVNDLGYYYKLATWLWGSLLEGLLTA